MRTEYEVLDVFTEQRFAGNPLAVVPDAGGLDASTMQRIAREFNLSETAFVLPTGLPGRFALRIFTPAVELPFAGHPTIGAAIALAMRTPGMSELVFHEGVGDVPVTIEQGRATLTSPKSPVAVATADRRAVARTLGVDESLLREVSGWSAGVPFTCVALGKVADLAALAFNLSAWKEDLAATQAPSLYVYAPQGEGVGGLRARMFAPSMGVSEDPATGAAAAALAGRLGRGSYLIEQGVEMGRPSRIFLEVTDHGVRIGGHAVRVAAGRIDL
jgi:trans-2,3-dihydro-3-hydroxyanthranilate isomerase